MKRINKQINEEKMKIWMEINELMEINDEWNDVMNGNKDERK